MIDDERQDLAADYALEALEGHAAHTFEAELAADPELHALARELRDAAAKLAHTALQQLPPPELREKILARVRAEAMIATQAEAAKTAATPVARTSRNILPWALAAGFAVTASAMWMERNSWRDDAKSLQTEVLLLRNKDALANVRISTLTAQVETFAKSTAVIVWDPQKQQGVLKLSNLPPAGQGKDYQLWVVDPKYPHPVNGGVVPIGADGFARVSFKPDEPVGKADKFAISVEPTGGVPQATGPIILLGN